MDSCLYFRLCLIFCCFDLFTVTYSSSSSTKPLCHENESKALLQFKQNFVTDKFASLHPSAYPKLESWKLFDGKSNSCCSWDGVECDQDTGHVIGLDLSSSFLHGSINSNSSLFTLVHLRTLNLAHNDFNFSEVPSRIGHLTRLVSLNLSNSGFYGQIPSEISSLSNLVSLDLSTKSDLFPESRLKLEKSCLRDLVQNYTNLKVLHLSGVNISSSVPSLLSNMSSLTSLSLERCSLYGEFPRDIFHLPKLQILNVARNEYLTGFLPEFQSNSRLKALSIFSTGFYGKIPNSIGRLGSLFDLGLTQTGLFGTLPSSLGNLTQLSYLYLGNCKFIGQIPSSLANLSQLTEFEIGWNNFDAGPFPFPLGKLPMLTHLNAPDMNLQGEILPSLANLTQLSFLIVHTNNLVGKIPSRFMNLTQLSCLSLAENQFHGVIPSTIIQLKRLDFLSLHSNSFTGTVQLDMFMELPNLATLLLGENKLTVLNKNGSTINATYPKLNALGLGSCNLVEFPSILRFQDELQMLMLSNNKIRGEIPTWVWNSSKDTMEYVEFSRNFLTGFEQQPAVIPWHSLINLDLSSNKLQGSLPVPPPSTVVYDASNNQLKGAIPPSSICHKNSLLLMLDLSNNNLSGTIPPCLANSSEDFVMLNLSGNSFHGNIPSTFTMNCQFVMIDLGRNQLQGPVPRSLSNCTMLGCLVLQNNQIEDTFPSWLGVLPKLEILSLGSNKFHGHIGNPRNNSMFPKLRIIDLSCNGFSGNLPTEYIHNWKGMKMIKHENMTYMHTNREIIIQLRPGPTTHLSMTFLRNLTFIYSMRVVSKGTRRLYQKIQSALVVVDFSSNSFVGNIPESLGSLSGLQLLNLSNNKLTGVIPSSFAKLTELESLDLSQNWLSGPIPSQLTQLTFLSIFNVSHNGLIGPIPEGNQFDTFDNSSYEGNLGLCGVPLSKSCRNTMTLPPPPPVFQGHDLQFSTGIYWIVIALGYGSGLVVGLVIGTTLTRRYHEWFVDTFGRGKKFQKQQRRKGRRN